jgi:hypothetical protein
MQNRLRPDQWRRLVDRIRAGYCTPFLGAGASVSYEDDGRGLPTGPEIARRWADEYGFLSEDRNDLARVAQFMSLQEDRALPKEAVASLIKAVQPPDFGSKRDPHGVLARLPFKVYLTTNYDDFLVRALKSEGKEPQRHVCLWNESLNADPDVPKFQRDLRSTELMPLVFHLHGHAGFPNSIVISEDDYLDFLVAALANARFLPSQVTNALMNTTLLFIGYRISDWSFRVLFRSVLQKLPWNLGRSHIAVQLDPGDEQQRQYFDKYYQQWQISVFWGTAADFVEELQGMMTDGVR